MFVIFVTPVFIFVSISFDGFHFHFDGKATFTFEAEIFLMGPKRIENNIDEKKKNILQKKRHPLLNPLTKNQKKLD